MDTIEKDITEILYNLRRIRRKKHLSQKDVAEKMGTINYEILCMVGKRIPRIYIKCGETIKSHNYLLDSPVSD